MNARHGEECDELCRTAREPLLWRMLMVERGRNEKMWMVFLNGGWQPADNDAVVISWIQQGAIGAQTQIRHSSWPQPTALGMVPNFQPYLGAPAMQHSASFPGYQMPPQSFHGQARTTAGPAKASNSTAVKIVGALFLVGLVGAGTSGLTVSSVFVGVLALLLSVALAGVMIAGKFVEAAPPAVRQVGQGMVSWPFASISLVVGLGLGALGGFGNRSSAVAECDGAVDAVTKAQTDNTTFTTGDPMSKMNEVNAKVEHGRAACGRVGASGKLATLEGAHTNLAKSAATANCLAMSQDVLKSIDAANGNQEIDAAYKSLTDLKTKLEGGIASCNTAGKADISKALKDTLTKQVEPQIAKLKPMFEMDAKKKAEAAAALASAKAVAAASAKAAATDAQYVKVPVATLLSEYRDNEIRADGLYKGKLLQITGRVDDTKRDVLNTIYVTIGTGEMFEIPQVQCFFGDEWAKAASTLSKGMTVTVRGRVDGLFMNVIVKDCEFVPVK